MTDDLDQLRKELYKFRELLKVLEDEVAVLTEKDIKEHQTPGAVLYDL